MHFAAHCCRLWSPTCEVSEERGRIRKRDSNHTKEISGQNKIYVQDMLKNEALLPDANTSHTVVAVCACNYQLYGQIWQNVLIWRFQDMYYVVLVENALFNSSDDICRPPPPSSLLDKLSMDKIDSNGSFSRRLVCRSSDRSYNSTDLLVIVNCQLHFLPWTIFVCTNASVNEMPHSTLPGICH